MIEHYALYEMKNLTDRFGLTNGMPKGVKPRYNISPTQPAPVIIRREDTTELRMMKWGLVPHGAKDMSSVFRYKTFNVKSEKVFSKPAWEAAVRHQRCIVPANGFYLWSTETGTKDAYYFRSSDHPLLGLAGIYNAWVDSEGLEQQTYTILTIEANDTVPLPFKRMPVILHAEDEKKWLDASVHDFGSLISMMRPYEAAPLLNHQVSGDVGSAKIDASRLIEPIQS